MREITTADLADMARGAAILGTGGGGDPHIGRLLALAAVREHGPVRLTRLDELPEDATVATVAMMGAPTVMVEKLPTAPQVSSAARALAEYLGKPLTHIVCAEAGGVNSMTPIVAAAQLGLPLVDADGMGRAFPELQMVLPTLYGIKTTPLALADEKGNNSILNTIDNRWAERLARSAAIDMGCSAMISSLSMTGRQARDSLVPATLSLCGELGALVRTARSGTVHAVAERLGGRLLFTGKVLDVMRRTTAGFARGEARISGMDDYAGAEFTLRFQNEHLVAEREGEVLACVPDLICTLDSESGDAVTTESIRYGQRLAVLAAPADPRWHTPEGLRLAGPGYFGYDIDAVGVRV